jgi:3-hydroxybutyrate dehydrogenase
MSNSSTALFAGKSAIITGSTSGIGLAIARAFAGGGMNVMLNGFGEPDEIEAIRAGIEQECGVKALHSKADMTKPDEIAQMVEDATQAFGQVDVMVNNAGIQHVEAIETFPPEKWDAIIAINLSAVFHGTRAVLGGMKQRNWGRIINMASVHGLVASPYKSAYNAAKHGVIGLTKTVALEAAESGVTVNAICPGYVLTPLVERQIPEQAADARHDRGRGGEQRHAGRPADAQVRHRRTGERAGGLPVLRRGRLDHRHEPARRRRLDGPVTCLCYSEP